MNILELKNVVSELKNSMNGLISNWMHQKTGLVCLKTVQQKISKLKQRKKQTEKRVRNNRFSKTV